MWDNFLSSDLIYHPTFLCYQVTVFCQFRCILAHRDSGARRNFLVKPIHFPRGKIILGLPWIQTRNSHWNYKYFSNLDFCWTYNLICIYEADEKRATSSTTRGHEEYKLMHYDLTNAPPVFQVFVNELPDLPNTLLGTLYWYWEGFLIALKTAVGTIVHEMVK